MKLFACTRCGNILHFENTSCERCGCAVGFHVPTLELMTLIPHDRGEGLAEWSHPEGNAWTLCRNHSQGVCNWLVDASSASGLCMACELNRYIPNIDSIEKREGWRSLEFAKHRLVYSLLRLKLPVQSKIHAPSSGMVFDFIDTNQVVPADAEHRTGHADGQITITLDEADPVRREQTRVEMGERYRTLLGHLRHEVGHYYWDLLIYPHSERLNRFRSLFGDESFPYAQAIQTYYQQGATDGWNQSFVTRYASSHPWEDWAETWAHYLHLVDLMEMGSSLGMSLSPPLDREDGGLSMAADLNPYVEMDMEAFLRKAQALAYGANSLNRCMGLPDLYPFLLTPVVKEKMSFVHQVIREQVS